MNHRTLHIIFGLATILVFLASGLYMKTRFPDLYVSNEAIRYQFRANHIYILMSGLINLVAGLYVKPNYYGWRFVVSGLSTVLLLLAPVLLTIAFFSEPILGGADRPVTFYGLLMLLVGAMSAHVPSISLPWKHLTARL